MSAANDMTDEDRYEELVEAAQHVLDQWPSGEGNDLAGAVNELRQTMEMHGSLEDPWDGPQTEVRFSYSVSLPEKWLTKTDDGWQLLPSVREDAYGLVMEGISDTKGGWFPHYEVVCLEEFMAGQVCLLERGHEGEHRA